jgi:hypothetical protein
MTAVNSFTKRAYGDSGSQSTQQSPAAINDRGYSLQDSGVATFERFALGVDEVADQQCRFSNRK